jgi:hypothetical protein
MNVVLKIAHISVTGHLKAPECYGATVYYLLPTYMRILGGMMDPRSLPHIQHTTLCVCCVLCAVCCVLCAVCCVLCVLCAVCRVLCAVCSVLCAVCCVLCAVCCVLCAVCCVLRLS